MNVPQFLSARDDFFSPLESIDSLMITAPDLNYDMNLKFKDIKSFSSYLSAVFTLEPIFSFEPFFLSNQAVGADEHLNFEQFKETTVLNDSKTFLFQATTFANKVPLKFSDIALLGESNTYKPFGSTDVTAVDSLLTSSLLDMIQFSDSHFKLAHFKGLVAFDRSTTHAKGYTIAITDRDFNIVVIAAKYDFNKGRTAYLGLLMAGA